MTKTFLDGLVELFDRQWKVNDPSAPDFKCKECGAICDTQPANGDALCPTCCGKSEDGHEFAYDREFREHRCEYCGEPAPDDYYDRD